MMRSLWWLNAVLACGLLGVAKVWSENGPDARFVIDAAGDAHSPWKAPDIPDIVVKPTDTAFAQTMAQKDLFEEGRRQIDLPKLAATGATGVGGAVADIKVAATGVYLYGTNARAVVRGDETDTNRISIPVERGQVIRSADYEDPGTKVAEKLKDMTVESITSEGVVFVDKEKKRHFAKLSTVDPTTPAVIPPEGAPRPFLNNPPLRRVDGGNASDRPSDQNSALPAGGGRPFSTGVSGGATPIRPGDTAEGTRRFREMIERRMQRDGNASGGASGGMPGGGAAAPSPNAPVQSQDEAARKFLDVVRQSQNAGQQQGANPEAGRAFLDAIKKAQEQQDAPKQ